MNKITRFLFLFSFLFCTLLTAQVRFEKTFGSALDDQGFSITSASPGKYVLAGYTKQGAGFETVLLIKVNELGDTLWTRRLQLNSRKQQGYSVRKTMDEGFIVEGDDFVTNHSIFLIKTDSLGMPTWTKVYGKTGKDFFGYTVMVSNDGGYLVEGTQIDSVGKSSLYLLKTDLNGNILWTRAFHSSIGITVGGVTQLAGNNYLITGCYNESTGPFNSNVFLAKLTAQGDTIWTKKLIATGFITSGVQITPLKDGNLLVAGSATQTAQSGFVFIKIDTSGNVLSAKNLLSPQLGGGTPYSVVETAGGNIALSALVYVGSSQRGLLVKFNSQLDTLVTRSFWTTGNTQFFDMAQSTDGGFLLPGYTNSAGMGGYDILLVKADSNANIGACTKSNISFVSNTITMTETSCITKLSTIGTVLISGNDVVYRGTNEMTLCSNVGIYELAKEVKIKVYPNPFIETANFELDQGTKMEGARFELFDVYGKKVKEYFPHTSLFSIERERLPSAIYFWKIVRGNELLGVGKLIAE
jgi:hypothetical protein